MSLVQNIDMRELKRLTHTIKEKYNYDFSNYAEASFKRRVIRFMGLSKIDSPATLIKQLEDDVNFFKDFLNELTVNTTEMFRDPHFWLALRTDILPQFAKFKSIRIWHAGCSSGEEVFSMAILLKELGILEKTLQYATDIDEVILNKAKQGSYWLKKMDLNSQNYHESGGITALSNYYHEDNSGNAVFRKELTTNIQFRKHNLVQDSDFMKFDLILCRNVMIYFDVDLQKEVVKLFHKSCLINGYLCVGAKESIQWLNCSEAQKFTLSPVKNSIYKKILD